MTFVAALATARHQLADAEKHAAFDAEFFRARCTDEEFDTLAAQVAQYRALADNLRLEVETLEARACGKCLGTGEYDGASRYYRHGRKHCFQCGGSGQHS